jgi:hypothetical protein
VIIKFIALVLSCIVITTSAEKPNSLKEYEVWVCTRWAWDNKDVLNKQVVCLTWKKQDCSKRLHKEICMTEGRTS